MLKLTEDTRIYVADKPVDCRKAINGLASLVIEQFEMSVNDGSVYVFYNGSCDRIKCLFWDKNGFVRMRLIKRIRNRLYGTDWNNYHISLHCLVTLTKSITKFRGINRSINT
jgi:hypothetical protein